MTRLEADELVEHIYGERAYVWCDKRQSIFAVYRKRLNGSPELLGKGESWEAAFRDAMRRHPE